MPPPSDYVLIDDDSFSYQVQLAEFNIANERWFRLDVGANPVVFGWYVGLATGFNPDVRLYESDGTTLIDGTDGAISFTYPLVNNTTYYIQVRNNIGPFGPIIIPFNTLFEWIEIGFFTIPDGSFIINDDQNYNGVDGFPSAVIGPDGDFLGYIGNIPAGEIGDALPDGTSLWHDRYGMFGGQFALFTPNYTFVDDFTPSVPILSGENFFPCITNDGTDFYIFDRGNTGNVYKLDVSAATLSPPISIIMFSGNPSAFGVTRDGTTAYWAEENDTVIRAWDLVNNLPLPDLYTITNLGASFEVGVTGVNGHPGEILVLLDGTLVFYAHDYTNDVDWIYHVAANGTEINTYSFDHNTQGFIDHIHYSPQGSNFIRMWFFTDSSAFEGSYGQLDLLTGTFNQLRLTSLSNDGEGLIPGDDQIFKPSASCTMITHVYSEAPGGITVIKQVVSDNPDHLTLEFVVNTLNLDPATFNIINGGTRLFSGLAAGVYGVTEEDTAGFVTTYSVSNGDLHDAINFEDGDNITVTIINTAIPNAGSGIHKLVPGKRNDTIWLDVDAETTLVVKIPNPIIETFKY